MATTTRTCLVSCSIDLNVPVNVLDTNVSDRISCSDTADSNSTPPIFGCKRKGTLSGTHISSASDDDDSNGGSVNAPGELRSVRPRVVDKPATVICKVEELGKIINSFDDRRRGWVLEMGFGGLLFVVNLKLPRDLCYWLMSKLDALNERLCVGGVVFRVTSNQVKWVLGIPKGNYPVPKTYHSESGYEMVAALEKKFGHMWTRAEGRRGKRVTRMDFSVTQVVIERLMGPFEMHEEEEFKSLFLMAALDMVLCPTQCSRYPRELLPALSVAKEAKIYDWCGLVFQKLMGSAKRFVSRLKSTGYARGCGGCTLFLALFYLDRLNRNPVHWCTWPRIKVWNKYEVNKACDCDRAVANGEFGQIGVVDVAYGENHPFDARDADCGFDDVDECPTC